MKDPLYISYRNVYEVDIAMVWYCGVHARKQNNFCHIKTVVPLFEILN